MNSQFAHLPSKSGLRLKHTLMKNAHQQEHLWMLLSMHNTSNFLSIESRRLLRKIRFRRPIFLLKWTGLSENIVSIEEDSFCMRLWRKEISRSPKSLCMMFLIISKEFMQRVATTVTRRRFSEWKRKYLSFQ